MLVLGDGSPIKDSSNSLGGVLVDRALALVTISALAVFGVIIIAPWLLRWFTAKRFLEASTLSHGVLGVLVDRTQTVHELGVVSIIGVLSMGVGGIDGVVRLAVPCLPLELPKRSSCQWSRSS